jgi:NAD(P)-dependent dehydrogenase (short-subunit alcohol dehydrogenase family)
MDSITKRFSLEGRVALVTGAGTGLGARFVQALASAGAKVVCAARRLDRVEASATAVTDAGGQAMSVALDVTNVKSINMALDEIEKKFGTVDILVNNAGLSDPTSLTEMTEHQWSSVMDVNLNGPFYATQEVARRLIKADKKGSIINIASILGHLAYPAFSNYGVSKSALLKLTQYQALDLLPYGIRVNAIAPGYFPSEMTNPFYESEAGKKEIQNLPAKRLGRLEELDGPLLLLASNAGSYMNGSVITVDYGHSVRLT